MQLTREAITSILERAERDPEYCIGVLSELGFVVSPLGTGFKAVHTSANGASFTAYEKTLVALTKSVLDIWSEL